MTIDITLIINPSTIIIVLCFICLIKHKERFYMPQRTNQYQKLILYINRQLASHCATIEESKMIWDQASQVHREVDILITQSINGHSILVGIECTATKRKVDLTKVEQLHQKHKNLGISKTVIVSKSGFVAKAKNYAKHAQIDLLTFDEALNKEWPEWLKGLQGSSISHLYFNLKNISLNISNPFPYEFDSKNISYIETAGSDKKEFFDFIVEHYFSIFESEPNQLISKENEEAILSPPITIIDSSGLKAFCHSMFATFDMQITKAPLQYSDYNGNPLLHATTELKADNRHLGVLIEPIKNQDNTNNYSISINIDTI